jgi:N-acetylglutamate synthase-like GNAT family acetyltransferase
MKTPYKKDKLCENLRGAKAMPIQVVEYHDIYQQEIIDLILNIQQKEFQIPVTLKDQPDLQDVRDFYQKGFGNFWLALDGQKVVGTIALIDIGNAQSALRKMFVARDYRGKEKGVAQALLNHVMDWCKAKRIHEIYLGTVDILHAAQRFYEKNDFKEIAKNDLPKNFPIMAVDSKFYQCRLR